MLETLLDRFGQAPVLAGGGVFIGFVFGFFAQRSRFCLRSAVIEFARGMPGGKLTVWLFAFSIALLATQALIALGAMDVGNARQLAARGSLSGAAVGGALFGIGMILARGCSSRLLVLAAQGNLRSVLSGLVFAVAAQASWTGALSPRRERISAWWTVEGGSSRDLTGDHRPGPPRRAAVRRGVAGRRGAVGAAPACRALGLGGGERGRPDDRGGLVVHRHGGGHLDGSRARAIQALSFTGPSAEVLTRVLFAPTQPPTFDLGRCPASSSAPSSRQRCSASSS